MSKLLEYLFNGDSSTIVRLVLGYEGDKMIQEKDMQENGAPYDATRHYNKNNFLREKSYILTPF